MKKAALVLSGGGSLGVAHIGALQILEKDYTFDFLAGVSAGAIVTAAVACGKTVTEIQEMVYKQNFFKLAFDFTSSHFGLVRGKKILAILREFYEDRTFEELGKEKTLIIGTTDFVTGDRVLISSGKIADAVRASLSVPVLFEPYFYQGKWLVDGGLTQNFPLDCAISHYAGETIIGVDVGTSLSQDIDFTERKFFRKIPTLQRTFDRTIRIFLKNQQQFEKDDRVKILRPPLENFLPIHIQKLKEIEGVGKKAAEEMKW